MIDFLLVVFSNDDISAKILHFDILKIATVAFLSTVVFFRFFNFGMSVESVATINLGLLLSCVPCSVPREHIHTVRLLLVTPRIHVPHGKIHPYKHLKYKVIKKT